MLVYLGLNTMNLKIFYDTKYYDKVDDLLYIYECNPIFPFKDMRIDPDNLISDLYDATELYNFLNSVHFLYLLDQMYIGHVDIDGITYIIKVDTELNISVIGNNEFNWIKLFVDDDDYLEFKEFCSKNYKIIGDEPDYKKFGNIKRQHSFF